MSVFHRLSLTSICLLTLHFTSRPGQAYVGLKVFLDVALQMSSALTCNFIYFIPGLADGQWGSWSSWKRERECVAGTCVGNNTQTGEDQCSGCKDDHILTIYLRYLCLSSAPCGPWSDWGPCPDLSCSQIRTKECTETCDEGNDK